MAVNIHWSKLNRHNHCHSDAPLSLSLIYIWQMASSHFKRKLPFLTITLQHCCVEDTLLRKLPFRPLHFWCCSMYTEHACWIEYWLIGMMCIVLCYVKSDFHPVSIAYGRLFVVLFYYYFFIYFSVFCTILLRFVMLTLTRNVISCHV